jgi:pimeloyl-ACP methyl ester carboxylesterase
MNLDGIEVFYRQAGDPGHPCILLPHGYPCSSYQFRNLMPALSDRSYLLAPDFPGFGLSGTPERFSYTFDGYTDFLDRFVTARGVSRYALYLHDYGSQIGLRLAIKRPERVTALVIQNGDIYEDALGPKYAALLEYFDKRTADRRARLVEAVTEEGFRDEFLNDVRDDLAVLISPELWTLSWSLMNTPERRRIAVQLMEGLEDNLTWFPRYQTYLRERQPPTLIVWGPQDGYMPERSALAYRRDLPAAEIHLLDGGHWALETSLDEIAPLMRDFLQRIDGARRHRLVERHT